MLRNSFEMRIKQFLTKMRIWPLLVRTGLEAPLARMYWLIRRPESLLHEVELLTDYLIFRRRYGSFLHRGGNVADANKKLLVLSFSNYVAQVKVESMLAKALQLRGYTPVIITSKGAKRALKYYRLFGIDQFVFFDEFVDGEIAQQAIEEVETFFAQPRTVQDIKNYEYHGTRLGAHLLRTITHDTYKGSVDLSNPDTIRYMKSVMLQGIRNVEKAEVLLDRLRPEVIFTHHPQSLGEGDIYEVGLQRGINTIYWEGAQKNGYFIFKRYTSDTKGLQPFSLSDETWEMARQMNWTDRHEAELQAEIRNRYEPRADFDSRKLQEGKRIKTKEEVQQQLGLDPHKKTAVVFSHIVWDTSFLHGVDLFDTYEEWLVETVRAACENSAVNWIIKLHPANLKKLKGNRVEGEQSEVVAIRDRIGDLPEHVKLLHPDTDINTWSLFKLTDYCLTVRGTIGIEMSCYGIPVLTTGTGRYSHHGFTIDSATREEYLKRLHHIQEIPRMNLEEIKRAKKHAYCLFLQRPVRFNIIHRVVRKNLIKYADHPLASNYTFQIASLNDFISNPNLGAFAEWVLESRQPDFCNNYSDMLAREPQAREEAKHSR